MLESRGRAHLEALLGRAEQVVRITPDDILVLTGVSGDVDPQEFDPLLDLLDEAGVEMRGFVLLGAGKTIESIDPRELVRLDELAKETADGQPVDACVAEKALTLSVRCPRCNEELPVTVNAVVASAGGRLRASATADERELSFHDLLCRSEGEMDS